MKQCQLCGTEYPDDIGHCQTCGTRLFRPVEGPCSKCGLANELGTRYCKDCGNLLMPSVVSGYESSQKSTDRIPGVNKAGRDQSSPIPANNPRMPEWVTRFSASTSTRTDYTTLSDDDSTNQLVNMVCQILRIEPDEISGVQVCKRNDDTIDLLIDPSVVREGKRNKLVL